MSPVRRRVIIEDSERPLYLISVASELLGVHPQTLRLYEREGFVRPSRTGGQRMYSQSDLERLRLVLELSRDLGVNRAGVDIILRMRKRMERMREEFERMMRAMDDEMKHEFEKHLKRMFEEDQP